MTVTGHWLSAVPALPALQDPGAVVAERLLLLLHYGIDWDGWLGGYRPRYWDDILPGRVRAATYQARGLAQWWSSLSRQLEVRPRTAEEREEVAVLLSEPPGPVLRALREETEALVLRVRIVAESRSRSRRSRS